jgi:RNA polymerase sigma factor (sigma-70 family)
VAPMGTGKSMALMALVDELRQRQGRLSFVSSVNRVDWLWPSTTGEEQCEPSPSEDFDTLKRAVRDALIRVVLAKVGGCRRVLAEDAVDAAITVVWERVSQGAEIPNLRAYVIKVAIRTVLKALESERKTTPRADAPDSEDTRVTQSFRHVELRADIERAMKTLPLRMRAILGQHLAGKSYEEIAGFFNISPGTVGVQLNRARTRLRLLLGGWERR